MKDRGPDDKKNMQESVEELRRRVARAMRAEKEALERLKDVIHKYRVALPFMSGRSGTLEERLTLLTTHRDECNTALAALRGRITLTQHKLKKTASDHDAARQMVKVLIAQYTGLMEGKFPHSFVPAEETGRLADKKDKFMERLSGEMDRLQKQIDAAEAEQAHLADERKKLKTRSAKLAKRAEMLETKLAIYQKDIRDIILDLNGQMRNEQALAEDYTKLVELLKKIPALSEWGEKVFREAVRTKLPGGAILELGAPLEKTAKPLLLDKPFGASRRTGPLQ
ncbi:MAG: hypothetical protein HZA03_00990 [Nitrospinae bacterium]|nr:hypothetical protein [Nitrospinota bacterium]